MDFSTQTQLNDQIKKYVQVRIYNSLRSDC